MSMMIDAPKVGNVAAPQQAASTQQVLQKFISQDPSHTRDGKVLISLDAHEVNALKERPRAIQVGPTVYPFTRRFLDGNAGGAGGPPVGGLYYNAWVPKFAPQPSDADPFNLERQATLLLEDGTKRPITLTIGLVLH